MHFEAEWREPSGVSSSHGLTGGLAPGHFQDQMLQKQNMLAYIEARSNSFSQADGLLIRFDVRQNVIVDHSFNGVPNVFFVATARRHSIHVRVS